MSEDGNDGEPLAVQLARAGVEDADAIAAAVKAEQGSKSDAVGRFLSNTSPGEIADAAGSLLSAFAGATEQQPRQPAARSRPTRAATDGGDEIEGSPLRKEGREEMEESDDSDETEADDEG